VTRCGMAEDRLEALKKAKKRRQSAFVTMDEIDLKVKALKREIDCLAQLETEIGASIWRRLCNVFNPVAAARALQVASAQSGLLVGITALLADIHGEFETQAAIAKREMDALSTFKR
jgi:hypothetical protein